MMYLNKEIIVNSLNFGELNLSINSKNKIGNSYIIDEYKDNKPIAGLITEDKKEIIPIKQMKLDKVLNINNKDYCLVFKANDHTNSYHIRNYNNKIVIINCFIEDDLELDFNKFNNNYWLVGDENRKFLYDINKGIIVSTSFSYIEEIDNNKYHSYYYEKEIETQELIDTLEEIYEKTYQTTICGFLDSNLELSSGILDKDSLFLYDKNKYGPDTISYNFKQLINILRDQYHLEYIENNKLIENILDILYDNPDSININNNNNQNKILNFRKKV